MHSYYICVRKCENKSTSESERASERACVVWGNACWAALGGRGGATCKRQMVTQWSCSPTPSLFLAPFWVRHLFPVTSPESYLICFLFFFVLPSAPLIISSFTLSLKVSTQIFTHFAVLLSLQTPFLPFPGSSASLSGFLLKKSTWNHQEISLWLSFWPLLTQHKRHQRDLGFVGTNKKKGVIDCYGQWTILTIFLNIIWFSWVSCCLVAY